MHDKSWADVVVYTDRVTAEATTGLLSDEGIPAYVASNEHVPGLGTSFAVMVPRESAHRARWILRALQISEAELTYLATGEMSPSGEG